jgi:hypothetical protein
VVGMTELLSLLCLFIKHFLFDLFNSKMVTSLGLCSISSPSNESWDDQQWIAALKY